MRICPNLSDPQVRDEFETLKRLFGEDSAYYLWDKNNGNFLDRTAEGDINTTYISNFEKYNDKDYAIKTAALELLNKQSYDGLDISKAEPVKETTTTELGKEVLMNIVEGYGANSKGQFKLEPDQATDLDNAIKAAGLKDVKVVSVGTRYQLYDTNTNKYLSLKELRTNPKYSLSAADIKNSIKNKILEELKKLGVEVQTVENMNTQYGVDYMAVADIANKAIKFAKNEITLEELGEEGAHFFIEAMNDSPFVNRLMNLVKQNETYKKILGDQFNEYNSVYRGNEDLLAKEALGKLLGQYLINPNTIAYKPAKSLLERLWNALKSIFSSKDNSSLEKLLNNELQEYAHDLLTSKANSTKKNSLWHSTIKKLYSLSERASSLEDIMKKIIETEGLRLKIYEKATTNIDIIEKQRQTVVELSESLQRGTVKERIASYVSNVTSIMNSFIERLEKEAESKSENSLSAQAYAAKSIDSFLKSTSPIIADMQRYLRKDKNDPQFNEEMNTIIGEYLTAANSINGELKYNMLNIFAKWIGLNFDKYVNVTNPFGKTLTKEDVIASLQKADRDIGLFNRFISGASDNPDIIINLVAKALKNTNAEVTMKTKEIQYKLLNAIREFEKSGQKSLDWLFEKDENGNYTQNFISQWDYTNYEKKREAFEEELYKDFPRDETDREILFATDKEAEKEYFQRLREFRNKNVKRTVGWENVIKNKEKTLSKKEFLKWKARNLNQFSSNGEVRLTPSVYGELAHPKEKSLQFEEAMKDHAKKKLYETVNEVMKEAMELLPANMKSLTPNMAPRVRADFREKLAQVGVVETFKHADILSSIEFRADEDEFGTLYEERMQDFEGNTVQFLPIYYTHKIDKGVFSTDLTGNLLRFYKMALNYNLKAQMVDILEVGKEVLSERLVKEGDNGVESKTTIPILDKLVTKSNKIKAKNLFESYKDLIDKGIYGEFQKDEGSFKIPFSNRRFSKAKVANALRDWTQYVLLGGSPFVGLANQFVGSFTIAHEAMAKRYFKHKDVAFAKKEIMKMFPEFITDIGSTVPKSKLFYFTSFFDILGNYDEELKKLSSNVKNRLLRGLTMDSIMIPIEMGDINNRLTTGIAMLHNYKVLDASGKESTLYDQFEIVDGVPRLKDGIKKLDGSDFTREDLKAFMIKKGKIDSHLFGITDSVDRAPLQSVAVGRLLWIFRSFMGPTIKRRWSRNKFDASIGEYTEGYYRTAFEFLSRDLKEAKYNVVMAWNHLSAEQKRNITMAITEQAIALLLTGLSYALLSMDVGDDDDEQRLKAIALMAARTRSELIAFSPTGIFGEFTRILDSPTALMGLLDRVTDAVSSGWFKTFEKGDFKGWNKGFVKLMKVMPGNRVVFDFLSIDEKLKWYGLN